MIAKLFFIALSLLVGAQWASAEGCASVDLRSVLSLKIRDQGELSWCYAHTAADYLQFFNGIPDQISAADIAIRYNLGLWPRILKLIQGGAVPETGFLRTALRESVEEGYCPESRFPSDFWKKTYPMGSAPRSELQKIDEAVNDLFRLQEWIRAGVYLSAQELPFFYEIPGIGADQFFEILKNTRRSQILNELRITACDGFRVPYPRSIDRISMRFKGPKLFPRIHQHLLDGMPVSIDYFSGVLNEGEGFKRKLSELHTSLIMGQRQDSTTSECQYLLKNSYGESCAGYDSRWECQGGYLWIPESALYRAVVSYVSLEKD